MYLVNKTCLTAESQVHRTVYFLFVQEIYLCSKKLVIENAPVKKK